MAVAADAQQGELNVRPTNGRGEDGVGGPPVLALRQVTKSYEPGRPPAVAAVDLEIRPGEFFSLLGPSGSGKTTTLRLIAGFESPDQGSVFLDGIDVSRVPPYKRDVSTVFQSYALFPHMTVEKNVSYPLRMRGIAVDERARRVGEALELVSMTDYRARLPHQLSGGQRQRIALARALVSRPSVVLLDEPLGALDLQLRQQMQIVLKHLQRDVQVTFIYVTHDQGEALAMSDRLAVMNEGRLEQLGTPSDVYYRPSTRFVAGFIGKSNLLACTGEGQVASTVVGPMRFELLEPLNGPATLAIRYEAFSVGPSSTEVGLAPNQFVAVIREIIFLGDGIELVLACGEQQLVAKCSSVDGAGYRLGDSVVVSVRPEDIVVLRD
ncbi:MAG: ABC transporter ATP-binding protein [Actinomycetes bacterium]